MWDMCRTAIVDVVVVQRNVTVVSHYNYHIGCRPCTYVIDIVNMYTFTG